VVFVAAGPGVWVTEAAQGGFVELGTGIDVRLFDVLDLRVDGRFRARTDEVTAFVFTVGPQLHPRAPWDADHDGVPDPADRCRAEPEDRDGFEDGDGCPDPDDDLDGVLDAADTCRALPEDRDGFLDDDGCPDPDNDGDGLFDVVDACPDAAEDRDGFRDADGCPDPDNDQDGVVDALDRCPNAPEDVDGFEDGDGCPEPDNDGDGVGDLFDGAPNEAENLNFFQDGDGVPERLPPALARHLGRWITQPFARGRLTERGADAVGALASALATWPEVRVGVVVSARSSELAEERALTLAAALVAEGVASDRVEPEGRAGDEGVVVELRP
jgi:hypothetical protein